MNLCKIIIDDIEIEAPKEYALIQACEQAGKEIPRFCYHERLSIAGNCRMCLVEVKGAPKPQASCAVRVSDLRPGPNGEPPVVFTNSPIVKKAREGVMEFLLANHPLDCPICDQGGECDLQDQAMVYGSDRSRFDLPKRAVEDKNLGPLVKTVMTRCIHCTRCVRFTSEVAGVAELGAVYRGEETEITSYLEKAVTSELSGNVIDLCPVGALTSKPYAFQARPWELKKNESFDVTDAMGSSVTLGVRGKEVLRVTPRNEDAVNEEWISDKARFYVGGLKRNRLDRAYIRKNNKLTPASFEEAMNVIVEKIKAEPTGGAFLAGPYSDMESLHAAKKLSEFLGGSVLESRLSGFFMPRNKRALHRFAPGFEFIEQADVILLVGTNPRKEAAVLNARIRKAYLTGKTKIILIGEKLELNYPYFYAGSGMKDLTAIFEGSSEAAKILLQAKSPMMIVGEGALTGAQAPKILTLLCEIADKFNFSSEDQNGFAFLPTHISWVGASEIGFMQSELKTLASLYETGERGEIAWVYSMGADSVDISKFKNSFRIYQGSHGDRGAENADVILPAACHTEKDGTFLNAEGRVRKLRRVCFPPGEAKPDTEIFANVLSVLQSRNVSAVIKELQSAFAAEHPIPNDCEAMISYAYEGFYADFVQNQTAETEDIFYSVMTEYYTDSALTRSSPVLRECQNLSNRRDAPVKACA